jgi:hypothetical protein
LIRASKAFDLAQQLPPVDWSKALAHLPEMDIIKAVDGPHGIFADRMPVATGGAMIKRAPNDPAWYKRRIVARRPHDQYSRILVYVLVRRVGGSQPGGLQLCAENRQGPEVGNQQYAIIAPTLHCSYTRATEDTVVGERHMGDARSRLQGAHLRLVRSFPEGRRQSRSGNDAQGQVLHDGPEQVADLRHLAAEPERSP